jgi:hypothetical protein
MRIRGQSWIAVILGNGGFQRVYLDRLTIDPMLALSRLALVFGFLKHYCERSHAQAFFHKQH